MRIRFLIPAVIWFLCIGIPTGAVAQKKRDLNEIQKHSRRAPLFTRKKLDKLAHYLCKDLTTEADKVESISFWIAKNIKYSIKGSETRHEGGLTTAQVLKKRKAICGEYAVLFQDLCATQGIMANVVDGYTLPFDFFPGDTLYRADHAWNSVRIDGQWHLYDVTWAAGFVARKRQIIPRLAFKYLHIPYKTKKKFYFVYQPQWIDTSPTQMIFSHRPVLDCHQLLKVPVSLKAFRQMHEGVLAQVQAHGELDLSSPESNTYYSLPDTQKYALNARVGFDQNPQNHRVMGHYKYQILFEQYFEYYAPETKLLHTSDVKLAQMSRTAHVSDSMLVLSMADNKKEYLFKKDRSQEWKNTLNFTNKRLLDQNKEADKMLEAQRRLLDKTKDKQKAFIDYSQSTTHKWIKKEKMILRGPVKNATIDSARHTSLLEQVAQHHLEATKALYLKDSLVSVYGKADLQKISVLEKHNSLEYAKAADMAYTYYVTKIMVYPFIYRKTESLHKVNVAYVLDGAFDQHVTHTYKVSNALYQNQLRAKAEMVKYLKSMKLALQTLKLARKQTLLDQGEQALYQKYTAEIITEYERLTEQLTSQELIGREVFNEFRIQEKLMYETNKYLKREMRFEKTRHNNYMRYCRSERRNEDALARSVIGQVRGFKRVVEKTIKKKALRDNFISPADKIPQGP